VKRFSERYSPYKRSRMCELIQASPFREPRPFPSSYYEPFRSLGTVVCRQGVAVVLAFLGVLCFSGVLRYSSGSTTFWQEGSESSILTALFSSALRLWSRMIGCSFPIFFFPAFPLHTSPPAPSSSWLFLPNLLIGHAAPSPCDRNWKKSLSDISLVY
jgi:hypothetical protein